MRVLGKKRFPTWQWVLLGFASCQSGGGDTSSGAAAESATSSTTTGSQAASGTAGSSNGATMTNPIASADTTARDVRDDGMPSAHDTQQTPSDDVTADDITADDITADDVTADDVTADDVTADDEHTDEGQLDDAADDDRTTQADTSAALDAGPAASQADAGSGCPPFEMPDNCVIPENAVLPEELRCTGLYSDWQSRTLYCGVMSYEPAYPLWSDGLDKPRYVWLPSGSRVDVTDPDAFVYPVGTQFWKEFRHPDGKLAETRLMRRLDRGWIYTTYVWTDDESNAIQENFGVQDLHGSGHTVPTRDQCKECHSGRPDFILGWDAVMLGPGSAGLTRETLVERGLITWEGEDANVPTPLSLDIPGDDVERAALGYLHANCGVSCHNRTSNALALETGFFTRLDAATLGGTVQQTNTFTTGLERQPSPNAPLSDLPPSSEGASYVDLRPLDTEHSLVLVRMQRRNEDAAMPRLGTNLVDESGVAAVRAWIESMTEARGYPAPGN